MLQQQVIVLAQVKGRTFAWDLSRAVLLSWKEAELLSHLQC